MGAVFYIFWFCADSLSYHHLTHRKADMAVKPYDLKGAAFLNGGRCRSSHEQKVQHNVGSDYR